MRRPAPLLLLVFALAGASGCGACGEPGGKPSAHRRGDGGGGAAKSATARDASITTTSEEIYLSNLEGQIHELERLSKEAPSNTSLLPRLAAARYTLARFHNDPDELQAAIDVLDACLKAMPDDVMCLLARAEQEQSLHRFPQARADVEKAKKLGGDATRIADLEAELDFNDGKYERAIAAIRKARAERPSSPTWMREAQLEHDLGDDAKSDAAFDQAEKEISDTSPLPVAHLEMQRGIQNVARGKLEGAVAYFRRAVARMPSFVAANEHLAETLRWLGKKDEAIAIYENVVKLSNDPEFAHALAELYRAAGREADAKPLEEKARAGYERLLAKFPEAMYWHGSEFFASVGDTKRSLELLRKNLVLRPNSTSYVALARAEHAAKNDGAARKAIDAALAMPIVSASLFWTAHEIYLRSADAADKAKAPGFAERAKTLNPRIATAAAE